MPALDEVNLGLLITRWAPFLSMVAWEAPASLAEFARGLNAPGSGSPTALLRSFWPGDGLAAAETRDDVGAPLVGAQRRATTRVAPTSTGECQSAHWKPPKDQVEFSHFERFCAQAFLQPYAELLADQANVHAPAARHPICPFCGSPPLVAVLRQEGDGAKRSLICSFCRTEWAYLRIACPACEESREEQLRVYTTPAFDCVRVDACDTCRAYIKTIDLTQNGLAVPEVDELAAIPLTLWADEKGYNKVTCNIIGL
jgi:FdhE protein